MPVKQKLNRPLSVFVGNETVRDKVIQANSTAPHESPRITPFRTLHHSNSLSTAPHTVHPVLIPYPHPARTVSTEAPSPTNLFSGNTQFPGHYVSYQAEGSIKSSDSVQSFSPSLISSSSGTENGQVNSGVTVNYHHGNPNLAHNSMVATNTVPISSSIARRNNPMMVGGIAEGCAVTTSPTATMLVPHNMRSGTESPFGYAVVELQLGQQQRHVPSFTATNSSNAAAGANAGEEVKPRSLRFTWSMKTTSSLAPEEMMK